MGTIQSVTDAGDVRVRYPGVVWTVNPDVLTKISGSDTEVRTESNVSCMLSPQWNLSQWSLYEQDTVEPVSSGHCMSRIQWNLSLVVTV